MTYQTTIYTLLLASGILFSASLWASEDNRLSLMLNGTCMICHGSQGSSVGPATPTIAGMNTEDFVHAMMEYRDNERPSTVMGRLAKGYTEEEFQMMAEYFSKQPFVRYEQTVDPLKVKAGAKLHDKYCEKCHENSGYGFSDNEYSILAGQWMPYLQFSLTDFHTGVRHMPRSMKRRMKKMVKKEGEASLDQLVHFYGSLTD
jgi:cytochrome subunit of sulfide dehydrogenase